MKHIFSLLLILLCVCSGGIAQTTQLDSLLTAAASQSGSELAATCGLISKAYLRHDADSALYYAKKQYTTAEEAGDRRMMMFGEIHQGFAQKYLGDLEKSLAHHVQAVSLAQELGEKKSEAQFISGIATIFYRMRDYEQSEFYFLKAFELKRELGDSVSVGFSLINYGNLLDLTDREEEALQAYQDALLIFQEVNDSVRMNICLTNIGGQYLNLKRFEEAKKYSLEALQVSYHLNDQFNAEVCLENLGLIAEHQEQFETAESYYHEALEIARKVNIPEAIERNQHNRARALGEVGKYEQAFQLEREAYFFRDSMFQLERAENLARYQAEFDLTQKDLDISRLEEAKAVEELENTRLWAGIGGLLLMILVGTLSFFIYQYRRERLQESRLRELEKKQFGAVIKGEENERRRIAGDLHDSLGQLLSAIKLQLSSLDPAELGKGQDKLGNALGMLDESVKEVRQISHNLAPPALLRGDLRLAVSDLGRMISQTSDLKVSTELPEAPLSIDRDKEMHLFRIIQELVNNSLKHSGASALKIGLSESKGNIEAFVEDNGKGFDPDLAFERKGGLGWHSIHGRLQLLNGTFSLKSDPTKGTRVMFGFPT